MTKSEIAALLNVLKKTRELVGEGAKEGFNPLVGDWAEKLFVNNGSLTNQIKILERELAE